MSDDRDGGEGRPLVRRRTVKATVAGLAGSAGGWLAYRVLADGLTVGGAPLQEIPVTDLAGAERLVTDELVILGTWGIAILGLFLLASLLRGVLSDRWLRRFGTTGAEISGDRSAAGIDGQQSAQLLALTRQVGDIERTTGDDRRKLAEFSDDLNRLTQALATSHAPRRWWQRRSDADLRNS